MAHSASMTSDESFSLYCNSCTEAFSLLFANFGSEHDASFHSEVLLYDNVDALETSAAAGCPSCILFRHTYHVRKTNNWEIPSDRDCTFRLQRKRNYRPDNLTTSQVTLKIQEAEYDVMYFRELPPLPGREEAHRLVSSWFDIDRAPVDSDELQLGEVFDESDTSAFNFMKRMLTDCRSSHGTLCNTDLLVKADAREFLPTRLIEITEKDERLRLRLVLSDFIMCNKTARMRPPQYTTLSYCWGVHTNFFTTTAENYSIHQHGIEYEELPTTFRHAIFITHKLGLRYIWIDAVCIIQPTKGDTTDWDKEAPMMHSIYRCSLITLSASSADSVDAGCYAQRPALKYGVKPCLVTDLLPGRFDISQRNPREFMLRTVAPRWQSNIEIAPVSRRGWILQERMLSRRILHFTHEAIFWECTQLKASEYEPTGCNQTRFASPLLHTLLSGGDACEEWWGVVEKFSSRKLTSQTDKLPALSGIATMVNEARPDQYLAGMWYRDLPKSLLWWSPLYEYDVQNKPLHRISEIPTWSWASVTTPVDFNQVHNYTDHVVESKETGCGWQLRVLDSSIQLATESPFGRTSGGLLRVLGQMKTFSLCDIDRDQVLGKGNIPLNTVEISHSAHVFVDESQWLLRKDLTEVSIPCVLLFSEQHQPIPRKRGLLCGYLTYLALEKVPGSRCQYKRIGILREEYFRNDLTLQNDGITTEQVEGISDSVEEIELI